MGEAEASRSRPRGQSPTGPTKPQESGQSRGGGQRRGREGRRRGLAWALTFGHQEILERLDALGSLLPCVVIGRRPLPADTASRCGHTLVWSPQGPSMGPGPLPSASHGAWPHVRPGPGHLDPELLPRLAGAGPSDSAGPVGRGRLPAATSALPSCPHAAGRGLAPFQGRWP